MLHRDCRKTEDSEERSEFIEAVCVEKLLIVDGISFIIGPPAMVSVESISTQFVPPSPFVSKTFPVERKSPVFESRAYTLRRTVVSDIASPFWIEKLCENYPR
jgi:hypothetical protein